MRGFYRSEYVVGDEKRIMATTQFEATDARRAFPCWDEPAIKATFEATLEVPEDRVAISNMPIVESKTAPGGIKAVRFAESPIMSTYLLAFIVGEFDHVEQKTKEGVVVRVYTPLGKKDQGRFALDVASRTLSFFDDYFGIPYPLPKMDLIAIADFAAGAMENWGAVTYRETAILVDPDQSSEATRQRVAVVIAHELAHQWFGNLVTMEWWTHLWLNEGFASWIEYLAVDKLFPEWQMWTQFVYSDLSRALDLDGLENTHPIEVEVKDPNEISEIFDAISYSKGSSVIRMLAGYLGEETFRRGLHDYLKRHQYNNATTEDLWRALGEASGKPVKEIMDTWTKQGGYPVLSVEEKSGSLLLNQARFFLSGIPRKEKDTTQWQIPVGVAGADLAIEASTLLGTPSGQVKLTEQKKGWLKVNNGQTGYYRVKYSPGLMSGLSHAVESMELSPEDRLGLENDAFALARAGLLSTEHALDLAVAYKNETDYTVWADLSAGLDELDALLWGDACYENFEAFARHLYEGLAGRIGWDKKSGESHLTTLLRSLVISVLGGYGDTKTIDEAKKRFHDLQRNPKTLPPDLRFPVYRLYVGNGDKGAYEAVLDLFRKADLHEERLRCLRALGYSQDKDLLQRTLELSLSSEVRAQDTPLLVGSVAANGLGRDLAWEFLKGQWAEFDRRYGKGGFLLGRVISSTTVNFHSEEKAKEVEEFFHAHPVPAAERTIRQSVERIHSNHLWLKRDAAVIRQWLEKAAKAAG
ncbi:MAG: M1 family peptidase [Deltaproteobacteria bacterium]|nr:M1 family peptidase [Deltaproteobacteria bacterium]